jgi:hypothetical protein
LRKLCLPILMTLAFGGSSAAAMAAGNPSPSGTGPPSQSCQAQPASPGHSAASPGAPFNEPTDTSAGGIGGQHYSANSQYDVACYQVSTH